VTAHHARPYPPQAGVLKVHQQGRPVVGILGDKSVIWRVGRDGHVDVGDGESWMECDDEVQRACCAVRDACPCLALPCSLSEWMELDRPADEDQVTALSTQSAVSRVMSMV
jgi:hypothetical protein